MPYRIDPNTGQPVWDGTSIPQASRDSLSTQIRELQAQIDALSFIDLDDVPTAYTGQSGKILAVKATEDGLEFVADGGGSGGVSDGDKGDIVVSSSGTVWTIDAGAVTSSKIATGAVGATQLASTTVTAGSYTLASITVDADGRITAASNGSAGSGTVTSVSIIDANGVSGTVATSTSTPAITLTLGAITPTSVNGVAITNGGSGALTVTGTVSVSGTNTGDQTITLTGDVTGSGTGSFAATIAANAVTTTKINNAAVTNAKLANANALTIKSNLSGSAAVPADNSLEDVASAMPVFGAAQRGMVPAFGAGTNGRVLTPVGFTDTLAFGTLTASDPLAITQTWNNAAVVFTGLDMVITQTAANPSSYLLRFRGGAAGATDRYSVQIDGTTTQAGGASWLGGGCGISSGPGFFLNDTSARIQLGNSTGSPNFYREADGGMGLRNGTTAQSSRVYDNFGSATDYHRASIATVRASLSALSGASVTSAGLIPAGAIVVGVTAKVLTAVTGATSWQLGTAADPDRFAASGGIALGSTTDNRNWTSGALECFLTATDIILTANGSNFTAGAVYISVQYIRGEAD